MVVSKAIASYAGGVALSGVMDAAIEIANDLAGEMLSEVAAKIVVEGAIKNACLLGIDSVSSLIQGKSIDENDIWKQFISLGLDACEEILELDTNDVIAGLKDSIEKIEFPGADGLGDGWQHTRRLFGDSLTIGGVDADLLREKGYHKAADGIEALIEDHKM